MKRELFALALDLLYSTPLVEVPRELLLTRKEIREIIGGCRGLDEIPLLLEVTKMLPHEQGYVVGNGFAALKIRGDTTTIDMDEMYQEYIIVRFGSGYLGAVHVHPVFLPIPSPSDALAAEKLGSRIEVVAAKTRSNVDDAVRGVVTFVRPRPHVKWGEAAVALEDFAETVADVVERFLPAEEGDEVLFLPVPSYEEGIRLVRLFADEFSELLDVSFEIVTLEHLRQRRRRRKTRTRGAYQTPVPQAPMALAQ